MTGNGLYKLSMVIEGMAYYCYTHITLTWLSRGAILILVYVLMYLTDLWTTE